MTNDARQKISLILSAAVTAIVFIYALLKLNYSDVISILAQARWHWLYAAFTAYALVYFFRAIRFQILMSDENISLSKLWAVTCMYGMFNYIMPAKSGELSFIALAKKIFGMDLLQGTSILLTTRFFDLVVIAFFLPFILFGYRFQLSVTAIYVSILFFASIFTFGVIFFLWLKGNVPPYVEDEYNMGRSGWKSSISRFYSQVHQALHLIEHRKLHAKLFLCSVLIWVFICLNFYFIVLGLGQSITLVQTTVILFFVIPLTLIPLQGIANVGAHEIGWVAAFSLFHYPPDVSLLIALSSHVVILIFVLVFGLLGFLLNFIER